MGEDRAGGVGGEPPLVELDARALASRAERAFRAGNRARLALARYLLALEESRGYLALGHPTLAAWARERFGWSRARSG